MSEFVVFFFVFATGPCWLVVNIKNVLKDSRCKTFKQAIAGARYSAKFFPGEATALFLLRRKFLLYLVLSVPMLCLLVLSVAEFIAEARQMIGDIRRPRFLLF